MPTNFKPPCTLQIEIRTTQSLALHEHDPVQKNYEKNWIYEHISEERDRTKQLLYTKQRNYCVSLFRKSKREYNSSTDKKNITDNKNVLENFKNREK